MVLNHETYILDLVEANKGNVQWKFEYSAKVLLCPLFYCCALVGDHYFVII